MLVLTFYHRTNSIVVAHYKLYGKKFILNNKSSIETTNTSQLTCKKFNAQQKLVKQTYIEDGFENNQFNYSKILNIDFFTNLNPDIIVHKISIGGHESDSICRLNKINIEKLHRFNSLAPQLQPKELELAKFTELVFNEAKQYACFNDNFHNTVEQPYNLIFANLKQISNIEFYGTSGLIFSSIVNKIPDLTDKKISKGKWVIIYLEDNHTNLCAVKNSKSIYCTNSEIWHELADKHNGEPISPNLLNVISENTSYSLEEFVHKSLLYNMSNITNEETITKLTEQYYLQQISNSVCKMGAILGGIDGIIFTGKIAHNSAKLRQAIGNKLAWIGVTISNKANLENQTKISKKNSKIQVFLLPSEPETAMLQILLERV